MFSEKLIDKLEMLHEALVDEHISGLLITSSDNESEGKTTAAVMACGNVNKIADALAHAISQDKLLKKVVFDALLKHMMFGKNTEGHVSSKSFSSMEELVKHTNGINDVENILRDLMSDEPE